MQRKSMVKYCLSIFLYDNTINLTLKKKTYSFKERLFECYIR